MGLWRHLTRGLRVLTRPASADRDLEEELRHWQDEAAADHLARGLSPEAARRAAAIEIGPRTLIRERVRDHGWERWIGSWLQDLRLAGRALRRTPVFTLVVVLVVALGSGAVATVFSAINALLLRPVPGVADPARLVSLQPVLRTGAVAEQTGWPRYVHLRDHARSLQGVAAWGRAPFTIAAGDRGRSVLGSLVSANYFAVLGVEPALGRLFAPDEERAAVVVVSHAFWRTHLGGDPGAIGRTVSVNGHPFTLIGVAPPAFRGLYTGLAIDAWAPVLMQPQLRPRASLGDAGSWLWAFGRLAPDVTPAAAQAELSALVDGGDGTTAAGSPPGRPRVQVTPLTGLPGGSGVAGAFLGVLLAAAALVLIIAGINVAALLSARHAAQARDLAVRAAIGAGRLRLVRQLLTEVGVLFAAGSLGGFAVATAATAALERLPLPASVPVTIEISPDLRVLAFAVAVALGAGLLFGLAPALRGARADITDRLRADAAGSGRRPSLTGRVLVAGQLALSLTLLVAAGLFVRAIDRGARIDPGFEREGVVTALFEPESWGYDAPAARAFYAALSERLASTPGVAAVSATSRLPLMLGSSIDGIAVGGVERQAHYAGVDERYFEVLRLPILRGRAITRADGEGAPRVAVVNETLARLIDPRGEALGRTFRFREAEVVVVGIARDAKYAWLDEATPPFFHAPLAQLGDTRRALIVRGPVAVVAPAIAAAVHEHDPRLPAPAVSTLADDTRVAMFPQRTAAIVTGGLGAVGLLLAALGLYGTVAGAAARRTREIGIRVALGADRRAVLWDVVGGGLRIAGAGVAAGVALAAALAPLLRTWLFGVDPLDVPTFAALAATLLAVAAAASYLPARRAAAVDPLTALRTD